MKARLTRQGQGSKSDKSQAVQKAGQMVAGRLRRGLAPLVGSIRVGQDAKGRWQPLPGHSTLSRELYYGLLIAPSETSVLSGSTTPTVPTSWCESRVAAIWAGSALVHKRKRAVVCF